MNRVSFIKTNIKTVEYLYGNLPSALAGNYIVVLVLFFTLFEHVDRINLFVWLALSTLVTLLRYLSYKSYHKRQKGRNRIREHYQRFLMGIAVSAALWGSSFIFIYPYEPLYQMVLLLMLAGVSSGTSISTASHSELLYLYIFLVFSPFYMLYFFGSFDLPAAIVVVTSFYIFFILGISKKISNNIISNISMSIERGSLSSKLRRQVKEAQAASEAKSRFLSVMSHEIRTPLNAIIGFLQVLMRMESDEKKLRYLATMDKSSHVLLNILNDVLDVSKIESGKFRLERMLFSPKEEFEALVHLFDQSAKSKQIELLAHIDPSLPQTIEGDKLRLKQIVSNLLSNAVKFTNEGGRVEMQVEFDAAQSLLYVAIKDNGIGIAKKDQKRVLEEFSQADGSTSRLYGGTGLGLSIVTKMLSLMGSELKLKSELGRGSLFYFHMPVRVVQSGESETTAASDTVLLKPHKILVAEDNRTNQMLMRVVLEELGIEVVMANDGAEALKLACEDEFDLILMDINMPNMNGIEALGEIRKRGMKMPIAALTANSISGDRERFLSEGFDAYLSKPIDHDELQTLLHRLVDGKAL